MSVRLRWAILILIPILVCAAGLVSCGNQTDRRAAKSGPPPREVELAPAAMRPMERTVTVTGVLAAQERSTLSAKVSGRLQQVNVDIGSIVAKGDILAEIEPRDYELGLQQAAAALAQARAALGLAPEAESDTIELEDISSVQQTRAVLQEATNNRERVQNLSKSGIASQSEVDTAEAAYKVALSRHQVAMEEARTRIANVAERRADLELARKRLADTAIRAPFDGTVQSRPAGIGQYITSGTPVVELVRSDPLRLRLSVPERFSTQVRVGQPIRLLMDGPTNWFAGQVARLSPALDEQSRMLIVEADVPARESLRPGLFARAELVLSEDEPGLSVPLNALTTFAGLEKIILMHEGKAVERVVTTGRRGQDWVEIVAGLAPGDLVVLNPSGLRTGSPLTVGKRSPAQGTPQARTGSS